MLKQVLVILTFGFFAAAHASESIQALEEFHAALVSGDPPTAIARLAPEVTIYESGYVGRSRDEYGGHHMLADMKFAKTSTAKDWGQVGHRLTALNFPQARRGEETVTSPQCDGGKGATAPCRGSAAIMNPVARQSNQMERMPPVPWYKNDCETSHA